MMLDDYECGNFHAETWSGDYDLGEYDDLDADVTRGHGLGGNFNGDGWDFESLEAGQILETLMQQVLSIAALLKVTTMIRKR